MNEVIETIKPNKELMKINTDLKNSIFNQLNKPVIKPLSNFEILAEKFFLSIAKLFKNKREKKISTWGQLTRLILKGGGNKSYKTNAIRFGHFELMQGYIEYNDDIITKLHAILTKNEFAFPWQNENESNNSVVKDIRMKSVDFNNINIIKLKSESNLSENLKSIKKNKNAPLIIYVNKTLESIDLEQSIIRESIPYCPFLFIIKNYSNNNNSYCLIHMISNHEIMDGLPASFYLHQFMLALGLQQIDTSILEEDFLIKVLAETDFREKYSSKPYFQVKSVMLGRETTANLIKLHKEVNTNLNNIGLNIVFELFIQLFLFSEIMPNNRVKGASLKFLPKVTEQLEFYSLTNIKELYDSIINNPENIRKSFSDFLIKDKHIGLYRKNKNVIENMVGPISSTLPFWLLKITNCLSKVTGASRASIGQVVITGVPSEIMLAGKKINLGNGFGGPTLAHFQDASITFGFIKDTQNQIINIVLRRKYKEVKE